MARLGFSRLTQIGMLASVLASNKPALSQTPAPTITATAPTDLFAPVASFADAPLPPAPLKDEALYLHNRELYGTNTMLSILTDPAFGQARKDLYLTWAEGSDILDDPFRREAFKSVTLNDYVQTNGFVNDHALKQAFNREAAKMLGTLSKTDISIQDAMNKNVYVSEYITDALYKAYQGPSGTGVMPDFNDSMLKNTRLGEIYGADGVLMTDKATALINREIGKQPLSMLSDIGMGFARKRILEATTNEDAKQLLNEALSDNILSLIDVPGSADNPKVADILVKGSMALDFEKAKEVISDLRTADLDYSKDQLEIAAKKGRMLYAYLKDPQDPSGIVSAYQLAGNSLIDMIQNKEGNLPPQVLAHLKKLPLSAVLSYEDGKPSLSAALLHDAALEPVKNVKISQMINAGFVEAVIDVEAAVVLEQSPGKTADDVARRAFLDSHTMGYFISGGDDSTLRQKRDAFLLATDKPMVAAERAASLIQPARNPWPQFSSVDASGKRHVDIPYSFDLAHNATRDLKLENIGVPKPFDVNEQALARYALERISAIANIDFSEVKILPLVSNIPQGVLYYDADLKHASDVYQNGLQGKAIGSMEAINNARVDIAISAEDMSDGLTHSNGTYKVGNSISTHLHEYGHAFAGLSHDFQPLRTKEVPGSVQGYTPGINENTTVMSYANANDTRGHFYDQITPMPGDVFALRNAFGARDSTPANATFTFEQGGVDDVIKGTNATTLWVGKDKPFAQTIADTHGTHNTLDASSVSGAPVVVDKLDLGASGQQIMMKALDGNPYNGVYIATMGTIDNGTIFSGTLQGTAGNNVLEVKSGGKVEGGGGYDTIIGGTNATEIVGGPHHHDKVILRADTQHPTSPKASKTDSFHDFLPAADTLIAPPGTKKILYEFSSVTQEAKTNIVSQLELYFLNGDGDALKSLSLEKVDGTPIKPGDVHLRSEQGKSLPMKKILPEQTLYPVLTQQAGGFVDVSTNTPPNGPASVGKSRGR